MNTTAKITHREIRETLLRRHDVERVRITRGGEIHVYTNAQRGDGGKRPWWQYRGTVAEVAREIAETRAD